MDEGGEGHGGGRADENIALDAPKLDDEVDKDLCTCC